MNPRLIIFFPNDTAAVCDANGQMPEFQRGDHQETIRLLAEAGIDWRDIPEF